MTHTAYLACAASHYGTGCVLSNARKDPGTSDAHSLPDWGRT